MISSSYLGDTRVKRSIRFATTNSDEENSILRLSLHPETYRPRSRILIDRKNTAQLLGVTKIATQGKISLGIMRSTQQKISYLMKIAKTCRAEADDFANIINSEIQQTKQFQTQQVSVLDMLRQIFATNEAMNECLFSYDKIEAGLKKINELAKKTGSVVLSYRTFAFAGICLFQYGSYSLAVFYFDKCLKLFFERKGEPFTVFERKIEMQVYDYTARIFLAKNRLNEAMHFAVQYLRRAWLTANVNEEMNAFDLLGKISLESEELLLGRYFHSRMQKGEKEQSELLYMSKQSLEKIQKKRSEYVCYETINVFIDRHQYFCEMLLNHYRTRSQEDGGQGEVGTQRVYIRTHRSHNRIITNCRVLERRMIDEKSSKELHFIRQRNLQRLKKMFSEYSSIMHNLIHKQNQLVMTRVPKLFAEKENREEFA